MSSIRVVHFGLGPIGAAVAREIAGRPGFKIVGGIDIDAAKVGRDLGDIVGLPNRIGMKVWGDAAAALKKLKPHVVVLCTSSSMKPVMPQIEAVLRARVPIVATTEELAYPGYTHIRQARQVDAWAKKAKVAVLGTGVNPGFVMDTLPIALTATCQRVDRVTVNRIQDARNRRLPFQQKIGAGLTTEQFQKRVHDGSIKHVGFTESIAMIADSLGWTLDRISDHVEPKLAQVTISSEFLAVDPGYVCGIIQEGHRVSEEGAGHPPLHGGVSRRAGHLRPHRNRRLAAPVGEDRRRHPRRHGDGGARRQFDPEGARRRARAAHHARHAAAVILPRALTEAESGNWVIG